MQQERRLRCLHRDFERNNNMSCTDSVRALLRHKNGVTTSWHLPTEPFVSHLKPYVTSCRLPGLIRRWNVADALNARHSFEVPVDKGDWIISMVAITSTHQKRCAISIVKLREWGRMKNASTSGRRNIITSSKDGWSSPRHIYHKEALRACVGEYSESHHILYSSPPEASKFGIGEKNAIVNISWDCFCAL